MDSCKIYFNVGIWFSKFFFTNIQHKELNNFLNNTEAKQAYFNTIETTLYKDDKIIKNEKDNKFHMSMLSSLNNDILKGQKVVNCYIIVFLCSIFEAMLEDFFYTLFRNRPELLNYCENKKMINIKLSELIQYNSKDEYITDLCKKAAYQCNTGKLSLIFKRIKELTKKEISVSNYTKCLEIIELRNLVVHENKVHEIKLKQTEEYSETFTKILRELSEIMKKLNIGLINSHIL